MMDQMRVPGGMQIGLTVEQAAEQRAAILRGDCIRLTPEQLKAFELQWIDAQRSVSLMVEECAEHPDGTKPPAYPTLPKIPVRTADHLPIGTAVSFMRGKSRRLIRRSSWMEGLYIGSDGDEARITSYMIHRSGQHYIVDTNWSLLLVQDITATDWETYDRDSVI